MATYNKPGGNTTTTYMPTATRDSVGLIPPPAVTQASTTDYFLVIVTISGITVIVFLLTLAAVHLVIRQRAARRIRSRQALAVASYYSTDQTVRVGDSFAMGPYSVHKGRQEAPSLTAAERAIVLLGDSSVRPIQRTYSDPTIDRPRSLPPGHMALLMPPHYGHPLILDTEQTKQAQTGPSNVPRGYIPPPVPRPMAQQTGNFRGGPIPGERDITETREETEDVFLDAESHYSLDDGIDINFMECPSCDQRIAVEEMATHLDMCTQWRTTAH